MNLRQAQRVLAELVAKCEAAHVQLPEDPFETRAQAVEALRHSRSEEGKVNVDDALEELQQLLGLEPQWQQKLQDEADKRLRRQQAHTKRKTKAAAVRDASPTGKTRTRSLSSVTSDENETKSRTQMIQERNPAKVPANKELADEFVALGGHELKRGKKQKGISRMKVAKQIRNSGKPVTSGSQARKIRGVGRSAAAKVDEYLNDGKIHALDEHEKEDSGEAEEKSGGGGGVEDAEAAGGDQAMEIDEAVENVLKGGEIDEPEHEDDSRVDADGDTGEQEV